jgi:hypothetical protein
MLSQLIIGASSETEPDQTKPVGNRWRRFARTLLAL